MTTRLLFSCYHFYLDPSNGASITAREILLALAERGWEVSTFCGCGLDFQKSEGILQLLADRNIVPQQIVENTSGVPFSMAHFFDGPIRSTVFLPRENQGIPTHDVGMTYLRLLRETMTQTRPSLHVTYGGHWMSRDVANISREANAKNVMLLQNLAYTHREYFDAFDLTLVPSQFSSDYYAEKLGIASTPIAPMMNWNAIRCLESEHEKKFVTFVNPEPGKGVYVFAQIAKQLWERRSDIPLLVVEGRCGAEWLARTGVDLRGVKNMSLMRNTPDARDFYRVSKIVLVPSLFMESFGRMAAEAMINGIPVIGSNRGALPEVIGDAGLTLEIPAQYTPESRITSTPDEVEPWVQTIIKLWDDAEFYENLSRKSLARAERWHPDRIAEQYDVCLSKLIV